MRRTQLALTILATISLCAISRAGWAQPGGGGGDVTIPDSSPNSKPDGAKPPKDKPSPRDRAGAGAEIDLRPKFITGRTTRYEFTLDHELVTGPAGNRQASGEAESSEISLEQRMAIALRTVDATETSAQVELTIETFALEMDANGMTLRASSDGSTQPGAKKLSEEEQAASDIVNQIVNSIAGTKLQLTLDERGNITSVRGGESLAMTGMLSQIAGGLGGGLSGASGAASLLPAGGQAGGQPGGLQWLISGASGQPAKARAGQTWTNTDKLGSTPIGDLQLITRHSVRSVRGDLAEIAFDGRLEPVSSGGSSAQPNSGRVTQSAYKGTYTWDAKAGELGRVSGEMRSELESGGVDGTETKSVTRMTAERLPSRP